MTLLHRPVNRKTVNPVRLARRRVVVSLLPGDILGFRDERHRQCYTLPIEKAYSIAVMDFANKEKARKKAERKARREGV